MLTISKNKGKKAKAAEQALVPRDDQRHKTVRNWDDYFKKGELEDWQRLMRDLGFDEEFASKTQCRKKLDTVWVNIHDFLVAVKSGQPVHHFESERALAAYTKKTRKIYPKKLVPKGSPLRKLLARIDRPGASNGVGEITRMLGSARIF